MDGAARNRFGRGNAGAAWRSPGSGWGPFKQAVNAHESAPEAEKAARFDIAEAVRRLEWGLRSYQDFTAGLTPFLVTAALAPGT